MIRPALRGTWALLALAGPVLAAAVDSPAPAPSPEAPGALLWPTDAGRCVTSSFCEFRPGHFHSGIDISTWGKVGYRCFAAADGDLVRARVSCGGYGRALYLRLGDGRTVVYAHLSRFAGALADTVFARQQAAGSAELDLEFAPGAYPVRRGEIIGWTGQSGAGVPHLHVEVRDALERPLDPLRAGFPVPDGAPPVVTRLALTPLTPVSSVDGGSETVVLDVHPGEDGTGGRIPRVIPVEGEIGLSVEVDETTDPCRFRLAPHRLELREEGGEILYSVEYDHFAFSQTGLADLQIDPRFSYRKEGSFHLLWRRAGNSLPFGDGRRGVIVDPADRPFSTLGYVEKHGPGTPAPSRQRDVRRALEIVAVDAAGNRGSARLELSFAPRPEVTVLSARLARAVEAARQEEASLEEAWADTVEVSGVVRAPGRPLREVALEVSLDGGQTWVVAPDAFVAPDFTIRGEIALPPRVPGQGNREVLVRAQAVDLLGGVSLARTVAVEGMPVPEPEPLPFEIVTLGPWFEVRFPEEAAWGALQDGDFDRMVVTVRPLGRGVRLALRPGEWHSAVAEWTGFDPWGRPVPIRFALPDLIADGRSAAAPDGLARYEFPLGTCPENAFALVRMEPAPQDSPELRPLGALHVLDTGQVPFLGDYSITLVPPPGIDFDPAHVGIFVQEADGLRYIDTTRESDGWVARTRTLLGTGLFEDTVPPVLGAPRLEEQHGRVGLLFRAEDQGAGLGCDAVEVLFEGRPILHELDDETGEVVAYPPIARASGAGGVFEMRVTDRCGNAARRVETVSFP